MAIITTLPEDATVVDLGAGRKARAEARAAAGQTAPYIKVEAGYIETRGEFSLGVVEDLKDGNVRAALTSLLADPEDADVLLADGLSAQDFGVIVEFIGSSVGEALASSKS